MIKTNQLLNIVGYHGGQPIPGYASGELPNYIRRLKLKDKVLTSIVILIVKISMYNSNQRDYEIKKIITMMHSRGAKTSEVKT
jgi:hypothetical protein